MSKATIRTLLESRLRAWADARPISVDWENQTFEAPADAYLRFFILPAPTDSQTLDGSHRLYTGVFQISIVCPKEAGPQPGEAIEAELEALFPYSLRVTSGNFELTQTSPLSAGPVINEADRYTIPMSGTYRADTFI